MLRASGSTTNIWPSGNAPGSAKPTLSSERGFHESVVTVKRTSNSKRVADAVAKMKRMRVYVGIPAASVADRQSTLLKMANRLKDKTAKGAAKKARLLKAAKQDVSNAELLFIFSKGSPLRGIPARPVLEPAIVYPANRDAIAPELAAAAKATLAGDSTTAKKHLKQAGVAAQRAAQEWFVNPANHWAPDSPSTIRAKGSDRPGVDTAAMRQAITYVVKEG